MPTQTFIPGKDAALETTIATLQERLALRGFHIEERSWLNPVEGIWSVHIRDRDCPQLFANGKGATELACRASALGEFCERLATRYFWNHFYLGADLANAPFVHDPRERWFPVPADDRWPAALLTAELQDLYNPDGEVTATDLVDFNSGNAKRGICALPYTRQHDGATLWFPVNIIANLYVSNGMAAGNTPAEARTQALSEIFERHVKFRVIAEGLCLPEVPPAVIQRYPRIAAGIASLRAAGFGILVRDASLGGEFPVINVTLLNPGDQGCYASFGAHPRFEVALERALTELLQGRALDALEGFPPPGFDPEEVASTPNLEIHFVDSSGVLHWNFLGETPDFPFFDWDFSTPELATDHDEHWLIARIHALGHEVLIADYEQIGVYACRIIVPGMSEIYPLDDLRWDNNSVGNQLRPALLRLATLDPDACAALFDDIEQLQIDDQKLARAVIGVASDPASGWEDLRMGELKTLLALASGNEDAFLDGLDWCLQFAQINPLRLKLYHCIDTLWQLDEQDLVERSRPSLALLYDPETLHMAEALLEAGPESYPQLWRFIGLHTSPTDSAAHQRLLAAYVKRQAAEVIDPHSRAR